MTTRISARKINQKLKAASATIIVGLAISACAGSGSDDATGAEEVGFEYGAPQEEVNEAIANLEPVTLTFQPWAGSESAFGAPQALMYKEQIEERSNGQIEIDIVWGQAIASYDEIDDALADGRLDIAFHIPPYNPSEYPAFDALMAYSQLGPSSPHAEELVTEAMMTELAWNNEAVASEFTDKGFQVLSSMIGGGEYYMMCNEDNRGVEAEDWQGRSIRAGSSLNELFITSIGASPVSVQYAEVYEALQRNTVACGFVQFSSASDFGLPQVASNISYLTEGSTAGRVSNVLIAGSSFKDLPLAYQQIIFDAEPYAWAGFQRGVLDSKAAGIEQAIEADGEITPLPADVQQEVIDAQLTAIEENVDAGLMDPGVEEQARELSEKWSGIVEELGYSDGGDLQGINDWYTPGEVDFMPLAERLYEEVLLPNRPE